MSRRLTRVIEQTKSGRGRETLSAGVPFLFAPFRRDYVEPRSRAETNDFDVPVARPCR